MNCEHVENAKPPRIKNKQNIVASIDRKLKKAELIELAHSIVEGNTEKSMKLSESALAAGFSKDALLKTCYESAYVSDKLFAKGFIENSSLLGTLSAIIAAMAPYKKDFVSLVKKGTVLLGAMESEGEWAAMAYTLPLLTEFGHDVKLVASFGPNYYTAAAIKVTPNVICLTCVRPNARFYIKNIVDSLEKTQSSALKSTGSIYDATTIVGCGKYLSKRDAKNAGCHFYAEGYLSAVQIVNDIIEDRKRRQ